MEAVRLERLSKTYPGGKRALKGVTLRLNPGEVFGFLGPNGAGKTTTVKILTGMALPSGGSCQVLGIDPAQRPEKVHALAGVVTEHAQMYDSLTGLENLRFYGAAFGLSPSECESRAKALLCQLDLEEAEGWPPIPPECGSGFPWPVRCFTGRRCCFWMSPLPAWTRKAPTMSTG